VCLREPCSLLPANCAFCVFCAFCAFCGSVASVVSVDGKAAAGQPATITIDEFKRISLRLAVVKSVEAHPKADKLYVLRLDVGDLGERQVVAGLKAHYKPEELVGKTVAFVANLQPAMLRGVESQGMVLAADAGRYLCGAPPMERQISARCGATPWYQESHSLRCCSRRARSASTSS